MKIALVTGASSGLGRALALTVRVVFPDIDAVFIVARRMDRLEALAKEDAHLIPLQADITCDEGISHILQCVRERGAEIMLLINNAGCGYLGDFNKSNADEQLRSIDLNVRALTRLTRAALDYMPRGARILNTSSIASFSPTPNMAVYCATKAYVSFFSRALGEELRASGRFCTCVCPAPMRTEFLSVGHVTGNSALFERMPFLDVNKVAHKALIACKKRRAVYTPHIMYKLYRALSRVIPGAILVRLTKA